MSEGDVSLIRDEDVLRRMWQQTEDFSRKKEIRAHMYRLREERLRNLYSPEPPAERKGVESARTHVQSFADQSFQGMKSKEVRDAASPPKEFHYQGQDLKELSNAGWNVESENKTTDDGHTRVRRVHANIEGRYDVDGGTGQFAAVDKHQQAVTEYQDDNTSLKRNESSTNTAAHEQVVRKTDDGTQMSSTSSKSSATSKFQQVSTTNVPYVDYDQDTNRNEFTKVTKTNDYEQNLRRSDLEQGELVSRKVDYPDDNTKVIVETRCLPDGTRVTSTRREFRAPVQSRSEQHSSRSESKSSYSTQQRSDVKSSKIIRENREFDSRNDIVDSQRHVDDYDFKRNVIDCSNQTDDYSHTQRTNIQNKRSDIKESTKMTRETVDNLSDVVDSRINQHKEFSVHKDNYSDTQRTNQRFETKLNETDRREIITGDNNRHQQIENSINKDDFSTRRTNRYETKTDETDRREFITSDNRINQQIDHSINKDDYTTQRTNRETDRREVINTNDDQNIQRNFQETHRIKDNEERVHKITRDKKEEVVERKTSSDQYQTTYQSDFSQKISNDWSPTQQAWASSLRSDTPTSTRPTTRASSPGSRTFQSSTSSLRSSVSPDKTRKPPSRGGSPSKVDRSSPARSTDRYSTTHSTHSVTETKTNRYTSPDRKPPSAPRPSGSPDRKPDGHRQRPSVSPEKRPHELYRPSTSPERKPGYKSSPTDHPRQSPRPCLSPERKPGFHPSDSKFTPDGSSPRMTSPYRSTISPEKKIPKDISPTRPSMSPDRKPGYQRPTEGGPSPKSEFPRTTSPSRPHPHDSSRPSSSPDRKPGYLPSQTCDSPEKSVDKYPKESPIRPSTSPDRKPSYMRPTATTHPTPNSPTKHTSLDRRSPTKHVPSQSPDRKTFSKTTNIKEDHYKFIDEETKMYTRTDKEDVSFTKRTSPSPDRFSGPRERSPSPFTKGSEDSPDHYRPESPSLRPSIRKESRSPSPPKGPVTFTQDQVDKTEKYESSMTDVTTKLDKNTDITKQYRTPKHEGSPAYDSPREPSPTKYGTYDKKRRSEETDEFTITTKDTKDVKYDSLIRREKTNKTVPSDIPPSPTKKSPRDSLSPAKTPSAPRQPSPSKYGTYEKNQRTDETEEVTVTKDSKDVKYDSLKRREKTIKTVPDIPASPTKKSPRDSESPAKTPSAPRQPSPSKFGTYEKKQSTEETEEITVTKDSRDVKFDSMTRREKTSPRKGPDTPASPTKKSPRDSSSPVKSPTKDAKYRNTTDFISTERTTEEVNKKSTKDHPRQLVTPSTSPTRKPKPVETAPSTGQSSPTTSVSGFVYFGSPRTEKTIVTDLDDVEYYDATDRTDEVTTTHKRPETLNVERSPSPSKIPCRSPSPEKRVSPKDSLPRKSSLKKPSTDFPQVSPTEKPPSSFRISPTEDNIDFPEHKVVKKDRPDKPNETPAKVKPPFERRETYEDRCRKILGMMHDEATTVTKETYVQQPESNLSTPSVSPCGSPEPKEQPTSRYVKDVTKVTDFISREQDDTVKKTTTRREDVITTDRKSKTPTRDSSPTKLLDIISHKTVSKYDKTTTEDIEDTTKIFTQSPDREVGYQKPKDSQPKDKPDSGYPRTSPHRSVSPEKKAPEGYTKGSPMRPSQSPDRKSGYQKPTETRPSPTSEHPQTSPFKPTHPKDRSTVSPEKLPSTVKSSPVTEPTYKHPKESTPSRSSESPTRTPGYMRPTSTKTTRYEETTSENTQEVVSKTIHQSSDRETGYQVPSDSRPSPASEFPRTTSPIRPKDTTRPGTSPERKPGNQPPSSTKFIPDNKPIEKIPSRASTSPDRKPGYMKTTTTSTTKYATDSTTDDVHDETISKFGETKHPASRLPRTQQPRSEHPTKKSEEPRHSRTPSPVKKITKVTEDITDFIQSEREQEILARVQQSLRKLSPSRDQRSPSREKSPGKTISLHDLNATTETIITGQVISEDDMEITEMQSNKIDIKRFVKPDHKPKDQKPSSKPPSRTVSPTKKPTTPAPKPESPTKSRSISPKKPVSPTERSQSPQVPRASGIKPREPIPSNMTRRPTPGNTSSTKTEKITTEVKKTTGVVKQNSFAKTATTKTTTSQTSKLVSPTNKTEQEPKRAPTPKGINKENVSPKKEETKVTRTSSDISIKAKKVSPQRMKSKPEIQVSDMSTTKTTTTTSVNKKSTIKEPQPKLAPKPKSATALNTSMDDDDIIIDVELAKSSRENSPDRICPTPINFMDDVGTPRFPDEVSEPDDEFRRRTHHTIHETESIVDDIVEICEDDELFVKRNDVDRINESDECLLSVTDKVSKFTNKIDTVTKPKDSTAQFKDTERRIHSDFDDNLRSDECLLSVSEKVNKFAKGPRDTRDSRSPSRRIVDEYDTQTTYQDDYTKLSVNDKAHLFVETAESAKTPKTRPAQKVERPDLSEVDESLKTDDCLLSVSDKVNKFVKTAEQFLTESQEVEEKDRKVKEKYEKIMKHIVQDEDEEMYEMQKRVDTEDIEIADRKTPDEKRPSFAKETTSSHTKVKDYASPNLKPTERSPVVKITTLRSSEAVKKAKALFENIASTTQKTKETKVTKLTDIGVIKKSPKTDSTIVLHPSLEDGFSNVPDVDSEVDAPHTPTTKRPTNGSLTRPHQPGRFDDKPRSSPTRLTTQSPEVPRSKSPMRPPVETTTTTKTVLSRYPAARPESPKRTRTEPEKFDKQIPKHPQETEPKQARSESEKEQPQDKAPSYQRPTKTSQIKEETKTVEETEVSSRRGSGKFGVELRRTSVERSTISSERRRSSEHHQPCIEDIFDLDLLEQMLEKVVGYEQRRRIRAQIRVARKRTETHADVNTHTRTKLTTITHHKSPERRPQTKSPERRPKSTSQKTSSPERQPKSTPHKTVPEYNQPKEQITPTKPLMNGHAKEPSNLSEKRHRPQSSEKPKVAPKTRSPVRHPSPEKKTRTVSPSKTSTKPKTNRFNEYATAYMKKVGLNEANKLKTDIKTKKVTDIDDNKTIKTKMTESEDQQFEYQTMETKTSSQLKSFTERTSSKDTIEVVQLNGKRSPSPEKKRTPDRHIQSPSERLYQRSPSPDFKRRTNKETVIKTVYETEPIIKKETIIKTVYEERPKKDTIKTVYEIEKKLTPKQEEKPSWVTNRNLKKTTAETRTFSSKKMDDKKYRATVESPRTVATVDAITSSYGPGPLDADGRPLFGIKALRNGASNYQVKGTVIRQEFHSRNGGEPEGSVSVTAYSTEPDDLARLLQSQGERPSRIHGLAAITTTKKFGGDTGTTLKEAHGKEERATLEQFTHTDRRIESRVHHLEDRTQDTRSIDTRAQVSRTQDTRSIDTKSQASRTQETRTQESRMHDARTQDVRTHDARTQDARSERRMSEEKRRTEERRERVERREDRKTVRQSSVKSLTEKYIKSAKDSARTERSAYPKAGLILRTANMRDSLSSDSSAHAGLGRTDSAHSLASVEDTTVVTTRVQGPATVVTTTTTTTTTGGGGGGRQERSFLDSSTKVTGVQDILTRMKNADIVIQEGDSAEDTEARALLNKFLGATVLMAGMQSYVTDGREQTGKLAVKQETVRSTGTISNKTTSSVELDLDQCWDERVLRNLLEECTDYEQRRRLRARIRTLMAEQEACASAVTEALAAAGEAGEAPEPDAREEEEVTVTSSVRRNSSEKTVSSSTTTKSSKVIESMTRPAPKPVSPFAKFRQLEKQNSTTSPNPASPRTPSSPGAAQPYFKFTDPALQASALTIKERLLQWCRDKTRDYENVKLENFSTSWADGLAFCALLHHFLPDAFDYSLLTADKRRHNFTLAFKIADEKAGIYPLLDVDDMVAMRKPDWKCVFTYVQSIHRRFKDQQ